MDPTFQTDPYEAEAPLWDEDIRTAFITIGFPRKLRGPRSAWELGQLVEMRSRVVSERWDAGRIVGVHIAAELGDVIVKYDVRLEDDGYLETNVVTGRIRPVM